jgi:hypothetical protein
MLVTFGFCEFPLVGDGCGSWPRKSPRFLRVPPTGSVGSAVATTSPRKIGDALESVRSHRHVADLPLAVLSFSG